MNIHGELRNKRRKSPQKCIYLDTGLQSEKPTKSEETNKNHFKNCLFFQRSVNQKHQNDYQVQSCHWNSVRNMLEEINLLNLAFHRNQIHQLKNSARVKNRNVDRKRGKLVAIWKHLPIRVEVLATWGKSRLMINCNHRYLNPTKKKTQKNLTKTATLVTKNSMIFQLNLRKVTAAQVKNSLRMKCSIKRGVSRLIGWPNARQNGFSEKSSSIWHRLLLIKHTLKRFITRMLHEIFQITMMFQSSLNNPR